MSNVVSTCTRGAPKFIDARAWPPGVRQSGTKKSPDRALNDLVHRQAAVETAKGRSTIDRTKRLMSGQVHAEVDAAKNTKAKDSPSSLRLPWFPVVGVKEARRTKVVVTRVEALVLKFLPERLSEEFFAKTLGIELRELHAAFRAIRGTGLYAALRTLRIGEVKRRLDIDERLSVDQAMRQCGFASYAWFRKEFLEKFQVDPKKYRNEMTLRSKSTRNAKPGNR